GTLTVTGQMGGHPPEFYGFSPTNPIGGAGNFQGKGELLIPPAASYFPTDQTFRGITIRQQGTMDYTQSTVGFRLGAGAVFEYEGTIEPHDDGNGQFSYGDIIQAAAPQTNDGPLDRGTFNARVPLDLKGPMVIGVPLNVYAGLTITNPL